LTDEALFPGYKEHIRFAALTLTSQGLVNFGECSFVLKSGMIAHRASVFEENSVRWMERHGIRVAEAHDLPRGYRAPWDDRGKLAVAKLGSRIDDTTSPTEFSEILLENGATSGTDDFVEVHIYGPMTIRTVEHVHVRDRSGRAKWKAINQKLATFGVSLEVEK